MTFKPGHMHHHYYPFPKTFGEHSRVMKVTDAQVREIRRRVAAGDDRGLIAAEFGLSRGYVNTLARRTWRTTA